MKFMKLGWGCVVLSSIASAQIDSGPGFSPAPSFGSPIAIDRSRPLDPNMPRLPRAQAPELLDPESWQAWWRYNGSRVIDVESALYTERAIDKQNLFTIGRDEKRPVQDGRPSAELIREQVVPALMKAVVGGGSKDLVAGALIALGRAGASSGAPTTDLVALVLPFVGAANTEVAESAIVALGWLGAPAANELAALLTEQPAGRRLAGGSVSDRERAYSAYALGLLGARTDDPAVRGFVVEALGRALQRERARGVRLACATAIGAVPLLSAIADQHVDRLQRWAAREPDPIVAGGMLSALARLSASASAEARAAIVATLLESFAGPEALARSAAAASAYVNLAHLEPLEPMLFEKLEQTALEHADPLTRRLALMSLVERPAFFARADREAAFERARRVLDRLAEREETKLRGWTALASGLLEHRWIALGGIASKASIERLRERWTGTASADERGAVVLALGLVGDVASAAMLVDRLESTSDDALRVRLAIALGLIDTRVLGPLRSVLTQSTNRPELLESAATGLVLQHDPEVVPYLTATLRSGPLFARASLARALGRVGDERAVDPLVKLVGDDSAAMLARAAAATALGRVADVLPSPLERDLAPVGVWWTATPSFSDPPTGTGFVDLL